MSETNSRKRDSERRTRVHLSLFDRSKFILLFGLTYLVLVWALLSENPIYSFQDAAIEVANRDRKSTRLNSSHSQQSRMPSSA